MDAFLFQATLYLLATVAAVAISSRLGLGSVLGYLAAGIVIGPGLGLVGTEMEDLRQVGEFGVVMMLFLIGLELEPRTLWNMRQRLLGLGGLQVVLTTALVAALGYALGLDGRAAVAVGMIFALSSTAIVLQTLTERKLLQTAGGRSIFSVLLMQDIAVIPMLALLPLLALPGARALSESGGHGGALVDNLPGWGVTLVTLGAVLAVILIGQYLVRPVYRFVHASRLREINTALALTIVVSIASLMYLVGLSPALGTFLAGVVLANSEFRHELESDIAPFKGLLLGLFFVTVGAGIDLDFLMAKPWNVLALTLLLMAAKALVLLGLGRLFRLGKRDNWLFTLGLAQGSEFGFVLISFALGQRILPERLAQLLLLIIALSMLVTPLLFMVYGWLARRPRDDGAKAGADPVEDPQAIIIAGVGRFGQVVNRMVTMSGFRTTVLDADLRTIQVLRRFGFKGYVGDPSRPEVLAAAGLAQARILVVCLDDPEAAVRLVAYARRSRPDLHIIARARDRANVYELYAAGANDIVREMFDSSLRAARYVLEKSGLSEFEAHQLQQTFFKMDRAAVRDLAEVWRPDIPADRNPDYVRRMKELNRELEEALMAQVGKTRPEDDRA